MYYDASTNIIYKSNLILIMPKEQLSSGDVEKTINEIKNINDPSDKCFSMYLLLNKIAKKCSKFSLWVRPVKDEIDNNISEYTIDRGFDYLNMIHVVNRSNKEGTIILFVENMYDSKKVELNKWKIQGNSNEVFDVFYTGSLPILSLVNSVVKIRVSGDIKLKYHACTVNAIDRAGAFKNRHELVNNNLNLIIIKNTTLNIVNTISGKNVKYSSLY